MGIPTADEIIERVNVYSKNRDHEIIKKAYEFSKKAHEGQLRESGEPFFKHPAKVALILTSFELDDASICAGLLHDVVEDADTTFEVLEREGFTVEIIEALKLLTHDDAAPYMEYVAAIKNNPIAKAVKLADLAHNSDLTRLDVVDEKAIQRAEKYKQAIALLQTV